jgi:hypothetical protein
LNGSSYKVSIHNKYSDLEAKRVQGSNYIYTAILGTDNNFYDIGTTLPEGIEYRILNFGQRRKRGKNPGTGFKYLEETSSTPNYIYLSKYLYDETGLMYKLNDCHTFETSRQNIIISPRIDDMSINCSGTIFYMNISNFNQANNCKVLIINKHICDVTKSTLNSVEKIVLTKHALDYDWVNTPSESLTTYLPNATLYVDESGDYDLDELSSHFGLPIKTYETLDQFNSTSV